MKKIWVLLIGLLLVSSVIALSIAIKPEYETWLSEKATLEGKTKEQLGTEIIERQVESELRNEKFGELYKLVEKCEADIESMDLCINALKGAIENKAVGGQINPQEILEYECSTNQERKEFCVCLSGTRCYYENCGKSPYGICTSGEWILI